MSDMTLEAFIDHLPEDHMVKLQYHSLQYKLLLGADKIEMYEGYLKKLSCLGNGSLPGNSDGNSLAQEALLKGNKVK
jgi:hypothetical protein